MCTFNNSTARDGRIILEFSGQRSYNVRVYTAMCADKRQMKTRQRNDPILSGACRVAVGKLEEKLFLRVSSLYLHRLRTYKKRTSVQTLYTIIYENVSTRRVRIVIKTSNNNCNNI